MGPDPGPQTSGSVDPDGRAGGSGGRAVRAGGSWPKSMPTPLTQRAHTRAEHAQASLVGEQALQHHIYIDLLGFVLMYTDSCRLYRFRWFLYFVV